MVSNCEIQRNKGRDYGVLSKVPTSTRKGEAFAAIVFVFLIWSLLLYIGVSTWKKMKPIPEEPGTAEAILQLAVRTNATINRNGVATKQPSGRPPRIPEDSFRWWTQLGYNRLWDINFASANIIINTTQIDTSDGRVTIPFFIVDFVGRRKDKGGDLILAVVTSPDISAKSSGPQSTSASAIADIIDHNDGSYTMVFPMLWTGPAIVTLTLTQPRELTNTIIRNAHRLHSLWDIEALFDNGYDKEVTTCGLNPRALQPKARWICNLTAENDNMDWYCAHPKKTLLQCRHWAGVRSGQPRTLSFTADEQRLFNRYYSSTPPSLSVFVDLIKGDQLSAIGESSCFQRPKEETWSEKLPISYEEDGQWKLVGCRNNISTKEQYESCLSGKTVILHGDYSLKQLFDMFTSLLGCDHILSDDPLKSVLQNPSSTSCHIKNLTLHWYAAEMPMYVGYSWSNRSNNRPLHVYLDNLTGDGSDVIVVLHLYTHFLTFYHSLYRQRVRRLSRRLEAALARLKKLTVVVKGPHYYQMNPLYRNSVFGLAYDSILKEELKRLRNRIIYLNFWDINLNSKNAAFFPEDTVVRRMINQLMSYVCPN